MWKLAGELLAFVDGSHACALACTPAHNCSACDPLPLLARLLLACCRSASLNWRQSWSSSRPQRQRSRRSSRSGCISWTGSWQPLRPPPRQWWVWFGCNPAVLVSGLVVGQGCVPTAPAAADAGILHAFCVSGLPLGKPTPVIHSLISYWRAFPSLCSPPAASRLPQSPHPRLSPAWPPLRLAPPAAAHRVLQRRCCVAWSVPLWQLRAASTS